MKKISILTIMAVAIMLASSCGGKKDVNPNDGKITTSDITNPISASGEGDFAELPTFDFPVTEYNFGTVIEGEKLSYTFTFTNVGKSELIISNVKASCGCTTPKWSKQPIAPGKTGKLEVIFNSAGRHGEQNKTIRVFANTQPNATELRIQCDVVRQ